MSSPTFFYSLSGFSGLFSLTGGAGGGSDTATFFALLLPALHYPLVPRIASIFPKLALGAYRQSESCVPNFSSTALIGIFVLGASPYTAPAILWSCSLTRASKDNHLISPNAFQFPISNN